MGGALCHWLCESGRRNYHPLRPTEVVPGTHSGERLVAWLRPRRRGRVFLQRGAVASPFALEKMTYERNTGMILYRS